MPTSEALAYAAKFIGGTEDATDLMQDIEDFLNGEIDWGAKDRAEQVERLTPLVSELVSKALSEVSAMLALKAQRQMETRRIQEMRVQAVVDNFRLIHTGQSDVGKVDIAAMTDALYGINGVQGV